MTTTGSTRLLGIVIAAVGLHAVAGAGCSDDESPPVPSTGTASGSATGSGGSTATGGQGNTGGSGGAQPTGGSGGGDAGAGGAGGSIVGQPCDPSVPDECGPDHYCQATNCTNPGACEARPTLSPAPDKALVCGCDGTTYWSAFIARNLYGIDVDDTAAECTSTPTCANNASCGTDPSGDPYFCSQQIPTSNCGLGPQGKCWGMPASCTGLGSPSFALCSGAGGSSAACTVNECAGIQADERFHPDCT